MIRRIALSLLLSSFVAADATSQTVQGRLLDGRTREPIVLATVTLLDTAGILIDRTYTDERGQFTLRGQRPGGYLVAAVRTGYKTKIDGILEMGAGGEISVDFYMQPEAIELDPILVEARRRELTNRPLANAGFYERQVQGFGYYITPEMIDRRPLSGFEDLFRLRAVPGLRTVSSPLGVNLCYTSTRAEADPGCRGYECQPIVYVDGGRIYAVGGGLDQALNFNDVAAVEVYRGGASIPLTWGGTEGGCAVVLFWTRK